ncbi:uncharacterized protein LOC128991024 [Macrosteles quadrilineatus]|uniref:uncharacterized protein LOC128991024 n=1 Tax=Macrosteles quadrilineatus TaxID=74068 RepID=UPI0023E1A39C|nr:uncharacterized protein LOC128991024 [Macrosteles quadrilineatus]
MAYDYEKLFLVEVFVDSVYISTSSLDLDVDTKSKLRETCIMFQFLDNPPLMLCEEDFYKSPPRRSTSDDLEIPFKSGKSCMFSLSSENIPSNFYVHVKVLRKLEDRSTSKIMIGTSIIDLDRSFAAILKSSADSDLPVAKTDHGTYELLDESIKKIGAISVLVRLSCFGPLIVTQFQVGAKDAFMFKGTEAKEVVEIPGDTTKRPKIEVDPNYVPPRQPTPDQLSPYGDWVDRPIMNPMCYPPALLPPPPPPQPEEPGNYKEIVAEIRGHSLHIRVPMRSKKEKELSKKRLTEETELPECPFAPKLNLCDCDYPVPPEAIPRCPPRCC